MKDSVKLTSKFGQMVEILKGAIVSGEFGEGARLTSENELSRKHGISRNTVREAISSLVQQGYLTRKQGKGTFVANRHPQTTESHTYAMFIHAQGHVHEGQTRTLVRVFQQHGAIPVVYDVREITSDKQTEKILTRLLARGLDGVVVEDGVSKVLQDVCQRTGHKLPALAVLNSAMDRSLPAQYVLVDFEKGAELGTRHLLALGRRRILFVIHRNRFMHPDDVLDQVPGLYGDVVRGYRKALAEAALAGQERYLLLDVEFAQDSEDRAKLREILTADNRPDAVFAFGDVRAKHVIDIADEVGLQVPEDLSVIGYWNTPWAEMTRVPLTSISVREEEVARIAAEKLMECGKLENPPPSITILEPELVIRGSCGHCSKTLV